MLQKKYIFEYQLRIKETIIEIEKSLQKISLIKPIKKITKITNRKKKFDPNNILQISTTTTTTKKIYR